MSFWGAVELYFGDSVHGIGVAGYPNIVSRVLASILEVRGGLSVGLYTKMDINNAIIRQQLVSPMALTSDECCLGILEFQSRIAVGDRQIFVPAAPTRQNSSGCAKEDEILPSTITPQQEV